MLDYYHGLQPSISLNPMMIDKFVWFRSIVKLDVVLEDTSSDFYVFIYLFFHYYHSITLP